jgi:hypothetical protein
VAWGDVACSLNLKNYFSIEKCDVIWGDFLEFLELFLIKKCDVSWGDMPCYLNFQNSFSIEKCYMVWGDFCCDSNAVESRQ